MASDGHSDDEGDDKRRDGKREGSYEAWGDLVVNIALRHSATTLPRTGEQLGRPGTSAPPRQYSISA